MFEVDEDDAPAVETEDAPDDALYCVRCGHLVTRSRWAHTPEGGHERVCANPAGRMFKVVSFLEAPGAGDQGSPTDEFSWFPGICLELRVMPELLGTSGMALHQRS